MDEKRVEKSENISTLLTVRVSVTEILNSKKEKMSRIWIWAGKYLVMG